MKEVVSKAVHSRVCTQRLEENVTDYGVVLHGLAIEILSAHFLSKSGLLLFPLPDAFRLGLGKDAPIVLRALIEPFDKTQDRFRELVFHHEQGPIFHKFSLTWWCGRAVQPTPEKRCAVFERSEFARRRGRRTA